MTGMFDDVVTLLADRPSMRFLAGESATADPPALRTATVLAAPAAMAALAESLNDLSRSSSTLELLQSARPAGPHTPGNLADIWPDERTGQAATNLLFGDDQAKVAKAISEETGVSAIEAANVLTGSVMAVFATVSEHHPDGLNQATLDPILVRERQELSANGWDGWLDTVSGSARQPPTVPVPLVGSEVVPLGAKDLADDLASPDLPIPASMEQTPVPGLPEMPRKPEQAAVTGSLPELEARPQLAVPSHPTPPVQPAIAEHGAQHGQRAQLEQGPPVGDPTLLANTPQRQPAAPDVPAHAVPPSRVPDPVSAEVPDPASLMPNTASVHDPAVARSTVGASAQPTGGSIPPHNYDFAVPAKDNSRRGDEVLKVIAGSLLVLGALVAIGLVQYWRADGSADGVAVSSADEQTLTDDDETAEGGDDQADNGASGSSDEPDTDDQTDNDETEDAGAADGTGNGGGSEAQLEFSIPMVDPLQRADATGIADIRLDPENGQVCWGVEAVGIGTPYDGHIHVGPAGVKGGIVVDFGPVDNGEMSCGEVAMNDIQAIVAEPASHYVEMHDPSGDFTIRAQLSDEIIPAPAQGELDFDPTGNGATTKISTGQILLEGLVPDQETMDQLVYEVTGLDESRILVVNDLVIEEGADRPTGLITVDDSVLFAVDSADLDTENTVIEDLALLFDARPEWTMTIIGHTDAAGDDVYNLELSLERAAAVRDALAGFGIEAERLRTQGAGSTSPVAPNDTEEGRQLNRRIEFRVDRN